MSWTRKIISVSPSSIYLVGWIKPRGNFNLFLLSPSNNPLIRSNKYGSWPGNLWHVQVSNLCYHACSWLVGIFQLSGVVIVNTLEFPWLVHISINGMGCDVLRSLVEARFDLVKVDCFCISLFFIFKIPLPKNLQTWKDPWVRLKISDLILFCWKLNIYIQPDEGAIVVYICDNYRLLCGFPVVWICRLTVR